MHATFREGMTDDAHTIARLLQVIRAGSSLPALAETRTGELTVVKFTGAGGGPHGLLTEFLATGIAARLGLAVPQAEPLWLPEKFPWQVGTDEFDDMMQRSSGWNLGLAFIPDAVPIAAAELAALPEKFRARLACVDALLQNVDRTAKNPNILRSPAGVFAIDHGSCLFLNRAIGRRRPFPFALPQNHFLAGMPHPALSGERSAAATTAIAAVPDLVAACPETWLGDLGFGREELTVRLVGYFEAFTEAGRTANSR
jgi:hypothetical protein